MTSHETLAAALAAVQAKLPKLVKGETAKVTGESKTGARVSYSYGYAGLDQVVEAVLPALGENGLSISSKTTVTDNGGFMLEVALMHEKGEREIGYWPLPDPRRSGPQEIGSAMTYGRRYLTLALTGTFPGGEDDDGAKAQTYAQQERWDNAKPKASKPVSAPPAPEKDWSKATDQEIGELHHRIETLPIGQAVNGYDWMAGKGLHNRAIPLVGGESEGITLTATDVLAIRIADDAVKPETTLDEITALRHYAETRGLLKMQVSEQTTLDEELAMARDTKTQAVEELIDKTAAEVG
jgi:hypothetical protein